MNCIRKLFVPKSGRRIYRSERGVTTTPALNVKVAICGTGAIGQTAALLLKMSPLISEIALYDTNNPKGAQEDLMHINTKAKVTTYGKPSLLTNALEKKDIVLICAGQPMPPGTDKRDLLDGNANVVREMVEATGKVAPSAIMVIVTNPVNSLLTIASEILKKSKVYNFKRMFGLTTIDCVRASTFAARMMCLNPAKLIVPVVGGHSSTSTVPLFSQASTKLNIPKSMWKELVLQVQNADDTVAQSRQGDPSVSGSLAGAYSLARFTFALCRAIKGEKNIIECAMVQSDITDAKFFASPIMLGCGGMERNLGFGKVTDDECVLINTAVKEIKKDIELGMEYMTPSDKKEKKKEKKEKKGAEEKSKQAVKQGEKSVKEKTV